jgi:hypothetical protein
MQVRTNDLVAFYEDRIVKTNKQLVDSLDEYAAAKIVYENKFLPKLFGWKYENSGTGSMCSMFGSWDIPWIKERIKNYEKILVKLEYYTKMRYTLFDINPNHEDAFFKFARENNLPY